MTVPEVAPDQPREGARRSGLDGPLGVVVAATLWGTNGTVQRFAPDGTTTPGLGAVRLVVGALGLWAVARRSPAPPAPADAATRRRTRASQVVGACAIALYNVCFFAAVDRTGVAIGTIIGIGSGPVFAGLLEAMVRRRSPSRAWWPATSLAIVGTTLLVAGGAGGGVQVDGVGALLALGAGLSYALYAMSGATLLALGWAPDRSMAVLFAGGAVLMSPLLFLEPLGWLREPAGVLVVAHLGLVTVALAYLLFGRALRFVSVSSATTLTLAEPLTAAMLGVVVLGERLAPLSWVGAALVLAGLIVIGRAADAGA